MYWRKNEYRKACENKEQFFTEKDCEVKINTIVKKFNEVGLVPYKCHFCGWWHYGHEKGIEKKNGEIIE